MKRFSYDYKFDSDFDTRLYLCNEAFKFIKLDQIVSMTFPTLLFPIYAIAQIYFLIYALIKWYELNKVSLSQEEENEPHVLRKRPDLIYLVGK